MTTESEEAIAREMVKVLHRPDGDPKLRPIHTLGVGVTGHFKASPAAPNFSTSKIFQGEAIPVTIRFSNASGSATRHDGWSDIRGMATRFHVEDPTDFDLIAMTLPEFFTPDVKTSLDFLIKAKPTPYKSATPWQKIRSYLSLKVPPRNAYPGETISPDEGGKAYANQHKFAQLPIFEASTIGAPVSYARAAYHAAHSFIITAPDGTVRWVRFSWQPVAGVKTTNPLAPPEDIYLEKELRDRLSDGENARFTLMMAIGEHGDDVDDCTKPWPLHRKRIIMGMLTLENVPDAEAQVKTIEKMSFNPWLMPDGIAPSNDPVLKIRHEAYAISSQERGANPCPFAGSRKHDE